jgi:hypothetical protein
MTVARYSLSSLFAAITAAAVAVVFWMDWRSRGEQQALERLMLMVWISSLVIAYWKSSAAGWTRVLQTSLVTGLIWTACVVATHLMFLGSMRKYGIGRWELLLRIVLVSGIGIAATVLGGMVLHLLVSVGRRRWKRPSRRVCIVTILVCTGLILLAAAATTAIRDRDWRPSVVSSQEQQTMRPCLPNAVGLPLGVHTVSSYMQPRLGTYPTDAAQSDLLFQFAILSPCKRLIVGLNGPRLFVVDANTADVVTQFEAPDTGGFTTATFFADGNTLATIFVERGGSTSLRCWRTSDWAMQEPIPLSHLVDPEQLANTIPILADHTLILAHRTPQDGDSSRFDIRTIALNGRDWEPVAFASMTVPNLNWDNFWWSHRRSWSVSPDGRCMVIGPALGYYGSKWIIRRGAETPLAIGGHFLGFLSHGATGVVAEYASRFAVNEHLAADRPPFWDLIRWRGQVYRVSLVDCATGETLQKSRWWPCSDPYLSESRRYVVAGSDRPDGTCFVWDTSTQGQTASSHW